MARTDYRLETQLIHAGEPSPRIRGAVTMPIFQSSTFEHTGEGDYLDVRYIRLNNTPNHEVLHAKLAALENGAAALVTGSGMAAISSTLLSLLKSGDHILVQPGLYGGTHNFITREIPSFGMSYEFLDGEDPSNWSRQVRASTRAVYVETLTNPLLRMLDHRSVIEFARAHRLRTLIDNTFATPVNFRPLDFGYDLVLHSASKYLNGHSDIVAGAVIGPPDLIEGVRRQISLLGAPLDPHACFLLERGLKTLALRVRHQNASAQAVSEFLEGHPAVCGVHYPGLKSHPQHELAATLLQGNGGMLSFELKGGVEAAQRLFSRLRLPIVGPSLGGTETLITRPALTSHRGLDEDERRQLGVSDDLIRLSVGLEAVEDLLEDFGQSLEPI